MNPELAPDEIRVIGCLIEKEIATPDQYPLSLNALTNACNQRSNREPVMDLGEIEVQAVLDRLMKKRLVAEQSGYGSRVPKYQHLFCNTTFGTLKFSPQELAIVCELFLRGPQTPGELRARASRLCRYDDVSEVETVLDALARREDGPFVLRLAREPGRRESRYAHTFGSVPAQSVEAKSEAALTRAESPVADDRLEELERRVAALEAALAELRRGSEAPGA